MALAAQNAAMAAESLGLRIVKIGGVRNRIAEVSELLGLPELACDGYSFGTVASSAHEGVFG